MLSKVNPLLEKLEAANAFVFDGSRPIVPRAIDTYQDKLIRYLCKKNIPTAQIQIFYKWLKEEEIDEDALIEDIATQLEMSTNLRTSCPAIATSVALFIQTYQHASLQNKLDTIPTKCPHLHAHHPIQNLLPILRCATNRYYYITFNQEKRAVLKKMDKNTAIDVNQHHLIQLIYQKETKVANPQKSLLLCAFGLSPHLSGFCCPFTRLLLR